MICITYQDLDSSKLKGFADDNSKFDKNGGKFSTRVENTLEKRRNCSLQAISPGIKHGSAWLSVKVFDPYSRSPEFELHWIILGFHGSVFGQGNSESQPSTDETLKIHK